MDNGEYTRLPVNGIPELDEDENIQALVVTLCDFYSSFLDSRGESGIDNDTTIEAYADGIMEDGIFSCTRMIVEFSYLDEMNDVVEQALNVNFLSGETFIMDEDSGCIYHQIMDEFLLYE